MKRIVLKLTAALITVILLSGCVASAEQSLREDQDNFFANTDPKYEKLISRVEKASHSNSYAGSILIAADDEVILYGGPKSLTREGLPADEHTTYDIGSCSKLFTAAAVFLLIEKGDLSLDLTLDRFFPGYPRGGQITIWHLMHMQSGIPDYVNDPAGFWVKVDEGDMEEFLLRSYRDEVPDGEFLDNLYAAPLIFEPGSAQSYSNTDYHLLALIIEQVTGMPLDIWLQENIFDPCGLEHTTAMIAGNETSVPKVFGDMLAAGMVDENGYTMAPGFERGAGGIHTCVTDLWAFDRALLNGELVSETSLEEMKNFDKDYGCGLSPYTGTAYGHSGRDGTYTTENIIIETESLGRIYFIASTSTDAGTYGLSALMRAVFSVFGQF
ncbi:MAG: beta-lactamase family protein [Clostridia bacterium]|nr:beta-lactamase family protein [Clostridia bacterium]